MTAVHQQLAADSMDGISNLPVKMYQDANSQIRPHLLALSTDTDLDGLDDLHDVGANLERSGILDAGTPNSLKSLDMSDLDTGDGLQYDGILNIASTLPQNLLPPSGILGQGPQPMPFLAQLPPESSMMQKQDLVVIGGPNLFPKELPIMPHFMASQNGSSVSTICSQPKLDLSLKFVSSTLCGIDANRRLVSHSHSSRKTTKSTNGSGSGGPTNDQEAPEYQRVMDILTEYRVQVAGKSAEALMPCKRRKSRPIVETVVEGSKSINGLTLNPSHFMISSQSSSFGTCFPLLSLRPCGSAVEQSRDLSSSSDSLPSVDSATVFSQNIVSVASTNSHFVVNSSLVTGRGLHAAAVPRARKLSCDKTSSIPSGACLKEGAFEYLKSSSMLPGNVASVASKLPNNSSEIPVKSCAKGLEPVPECHCSNASK